uniref:Uncharacterized protein n=1 Tax=Branchiostoma floridae TaxID=7739 RepID=C3YB02_BRAFL|eukprot:XP_002606454.1 hypothetical protein BRAFLDRAFT_93235 [Branchiostoma floridae]
MPQTTSLSENFHLRKDRLARSTHVSKLVSTFEALVSQPGHCTAAAGLTPVQALPDADQVLIRRSARDIKDELLAKTSSTPSKARVLTVIPKKPPRTKSQDDETTKTASTKGPLKPPRTQYLADSTVQTVGTLYAFNPAELLANTADKTVVKVESQKPARSHLVGDTVGTPTDTVKPTDLLRTLLLEKAAVETTVTTRQHKPTRTRSLTGIDAQTSIAKKPRARKPTRTRSLGDIDDQMSIAVKPRALRPTRTHFMVGIDAQTAISVRQKELLCTLLLGDTSNKTTVTVKPHKPSRPHALPSDKAALKTAVPVSLVEPAPTQTDVAARPTESTPVLQPPLKPSRAKDFVLHRNNFGHFGFCLLTTLTPDMETVHVVFESADSISTLPVGRLLAVNFLPVQGKTTAELYEILNRSPDSVRLRIQQLYFPVSVLQEMVRDQVSAVTFQQYREYILYQYQRQRQAHPVKKWMKRKLRGVVSVLSRCREVLTSCWR